MDHLPKEMASQMYFVDRLEARGCQMLVQRVSQAWAVRPMEKDYQNLGQRQVVSGAEPVVAEMVVDSQLTSRETEFPDGQHLNTRTTNQRGCRHC